MIGVRRFELNEFQVRGFGCCSETLLGKNDQFVRDDQLLPNKLMMVDTGIPSKR
jgi:hypothetical protein